MKFTNTNGDTLLSTSNSKKSLFISFCGIIQEPNSTLRKSEYSYLQYHLWGIIYEGLEE